MQLPYVHLEDYQHLKNQMPIGFKRLKAIFSATGWFQEEGLKLLAAQKQKEGVLRIGMQHGGYPYGNGESYYVEYERSLLDFFLTWGWKHDQGDIPFIAFKFSLQKNRAALNAHKQDEILYICTSGGKFYPDEFAGPSGEQFEEFYFSDQFRLIKELNVANRKKMVIRLYPRENFYGWNHQQKLESLEMDLRFDNSMPLPKAIQRAKLVVCDNFYSTFTEALILEVPTILFVNTDLDKLNGEFLKLFQQMREVGIAHTSTISAAKHIQIVGDAPDIWWNSTEVVQIRKAYLEEYGRVSANPVDNLVKEITKIISDDKPMSIGRQTATAKTL